jgi:hypothetical protein
MELEAVVLVFHAWDMDMCTSLLPSVESLSAGFEHVVVARKTRAERG